MATAALFDDARRAAAEAPDFIRGLADQARAFAALDGTEAIVTHSLVATLAALAGEADCVVNAFDAGLGSAYRQAQTKPRPSRLSLAVERSGRQALRVLDAAVPVYAEVCIIAADRLAVAEELSPTSGSGRQAPTAQAMAAAARGLARCIRLA